MTGKKLALVGDGPLSDAAAAEQLANLRKARAYVRTCTEQEAEKARLDGRVVAEWVRIHRAAASIAIEACRLQATAVRRLCELDSALIKGQERTAGEWLARMSDAAFNQMLAEMKYARSPVSLYNDFVRSRRDDMTRGRGERIAEGHGQPADYQSVVEAANLLVHTAAASGATSVSELAKALRDELHMDSRGFVEDELLQSGIESVIREALSSESFDDGVGHPDFVTWKDKDAGWLRIPWAAAVLDQLRWMAEYRAEQARELMAAAAELSTLVVLLDEAALQHPETRRLGDLWPLVLEQQAEAGAA